MIGVEMRILFIGSVFFSASALDHLICSGFNVCGVCTKSTSSENSDHIDLAEICLREKIPFIYVDDINSINSLSWISKLKPDVIYCFGWSRLLKRALLETAPLGAIGYHPAMLPQNRGRHPLIWALVLGLSETGSTFFYLEEGIDNGNIISQEIVKIDEHDDAWDLYQKITLVALGQITKFTRQLEMMSSNDVFRARVQAKNKILTNIWRKRSKADGLIDWRMSTDSIYNLIRGLSYPYVGAHFIHQEKEYNVWKAQKVFSNIEKNIEPGKVLQSNSSGTLVKTSDGAILLTAVVPAFSPKTGEYL